MFVWNYWIRCNQYLVHQTLWLYDNTRMVSMTINNIAHWESYWLSRASMCLQLFHFIDGRHRHYTISSYKPLVAIMTRQLHKKYILSLTREQQLKFSWTIDCHWLAVELDLQQCLPWLSQWLHTLKPLSIEREFRIHTRTIDNCGRKKSYGINQKNCWNYIILLLRI